MISANYTYCMKSLLSEVFAVGLLLIPLSVGAKDIDQDEAFQLREKGVIVSLESILDKAKSKYPGRIIEIELESKHDQYIYEIELLLDSGEVREMKFDARSGELIADERED